MTPSRFSTTHPLDPLSPDEITEACAAARTHLAESKQLKAFKGVAAFLKRMARTAEVHVIDLVTGYV
jgi:Cu2+-containing amine oxidase